ncbi:MAG TPA: L-serine ammonia-lyase, partial [Flavobacteriaceae bacterium]|nr:L-serine ammonia-lyase [Flavobacteriaceae bacterium]
MESISVFDMLKIGVGPSSSHTLGPWRAAERWVNELIEKGHFDQVEKVQVNLYGSLSLTGKGHATDVATMLGLCGFDPVTFPIEKIDETIDFITSNHKIRLNDEKEIDFNPKEHIKFNRKFLEFHPNGITFHAYLKDGSKKTATFYSIGGGFVIKKERKNKKMKEQKFAQFPYPVHSGVALLSNCKTEGKTISELVLENEKSLRSEEEINEGLQKIWNVMLDSMYVGCHTEGKLPGGLNVKRRAFDMHKNLIGDAPYNNATEWIEAIRSTEVKFRQILKWVSCFALSVNEVNASLGRVVTAPTNGSAGVIPAVMM